ncbi:hypothetical protein [Aquimarina macrocephali]|uniref:hypothetical protein n=1 Tax=Aquimarina macrocephali TaxID=666563 RepID=UPI003F66FB0A
MSLTVYHEGMCSNSIVKETDSGIRYQKRKLPTPNTGPDIEIGDIGVGGLLSDGSHLVSGVYLGGVDNAPESWDIIFGS